MLPYNWSRQVLLITSSRFADRWIVPGGGIEPEENAAEAAAREVVEEAGVVGRIERCLGLFQVRPSSAAFNLAPASGSQNDQEQNHITANSLSSGEVPKPDYLYFA